MSNYDYEAGRARRRRELMRRMEEVNTQIKKYNDYIVKVNHSLFSSFSALSGAQFMMNEQYNRVKGLCEETCNVEETIFPKFKFKNFELRGEDGNSAIDGLIVSLTSLNEEFDNKVETLRRKYDDLYEQYCSI